MSACDRAERSECKSEKRVSVGVRRHSWPITKYSKMYMELNVWKGLDGNEMAATLLGNDDPNHKQSNYSHCEVIGGGTAGSAHSDAVN